jgi:hypothetical protein
MCSSCPVDARLMCRAACTGMGVSTSRPSLVKDYSTLGDMAPRTNKRVVFDTTESHRVVRDHVRQDQLGATG